MATDGKAVTPTISLAIPFASHCLELQAQPTLTSDSALPLSISTSGANVTPIAVAPVAKMVESTSVAAAATEHDEHDELPEMEL